MEEGSKKRIHLVISQKSSQRRKLKLEENALREMIKKTKEQLTQLEV